MSQISLETMQCRNPCVWSHWCCSVSPADRHEKLSSSSTSSSSSSFFSSSSSSPGSCDGRAAQGELEGGGKARLGVRRVQDARLRTQPGSKVCLATFSFVFRPVSLLTQTMGKSMLKCFLPSLRPSPPTRPRLLHPSLEETRASAKILPRESKQPEITIKC